MSQATPVVTLNDIRAARERLTGRIAATPLLYAAKLSELAGADIYLKCENLQITGSFKLRGALNKVLSLVEGEERLAGVVTASSGNHGQAVAYAARLLGVPCTVVVPETVLSVKEQAIRGYGAEVIHCGTTSPARIELAQSIAQDRGYSYVPPYDDPFIVAGQGTVGLEVSEQLPEVQAVFVPVGGGGLVSGVATAVKTALPDGVRVFGVEPELANDTYLSRREGRVVDIGESHSIADGLRASHPGSFTFPIVQRYVDEIVLVSESQIEEALRTVLCSAKLLVEPSGCTSVAAALRVGNHAKGPIVCVLSGGNVELSVVSRLTGG